MATGAGTGRLTDARLGRRATLRGMAATGAAGALGALLAACGGGTTTATDTAAPSATKASGSATAPTVPPQPGTTIASQTPSGAAQGGGTPKKGGTIKAGLDSDVITLDPLDSGAYTDREVFYNMYDALVAIDTRLQIIPALAEKWETPDPKTYIFHLRQGVKFHDGTDFNADAVKWNIERYLTDKNTRRKTELDSIQTVEVMDPYTVKFALKTPFAPLLANLVDRAGMMLSPKAVQAGGADFARKPLGAGTGAFRFVEWVKDDHVALERNPNYWKKDASGASLPYIDKLIYRPIVDETVLLTNLKTGDLDVYYTVPGKDYASVKGGSELVLQETPGLSYNSFEFNTTTEPFNKKELRQAVSEAIDRAQINKTVFFGVRQVGYGPIPPSSWAFDANLKPYAGDVNKAKEYLKAGGKPDGFAFDMKITAGSPQATQFAQLIKDQVAKAGITMNIVQLENAKAEADRQASNFQATGYNWSGRIDPDGNMYNQLHTGGSLADTKYANPQADDLLEKARAGTDQAQRKALYQQIQKLVVDDAPFVWYTFMPAYLVTRPNVQGMQVYADFMMRFAGAWLK